MKKIFIWNKEKLYQDQIDKFLLNEQQFDEVEFEQVPAEVSLDNLCAFLKENNAWSLVHRNEHGAAFCSEQWISITNECIKNSITVFSFDFGYFNHYRSFMVDFYEENCVSSIVSAWDRLPKIVNWNSMPAYIKQYRNRIINNIASEKNQPPPLRLKNTVVIWGQYSTNLIRRNFYEKNKPIEMGVWMDRLVKIIREHGFNPIIKHSPVSYRPYLEELQKKVPILVDREKYLEKIPYGLYFKDCNAKLIAHADYHIINCSSVSNELLLNNSKVIAMGRSWFNDLGIFYEPKNWDEIFNYKEPLEENKNKWINWWAERQCLQQDLKKKIIKVRNSID